MTAMQVASLLVDTPFSVVEDTGDAGDASAILAGGVAYRSDKVVAGDLFFCVPGLVHDGHDFAADAAARGAVGLVVDHALAVDLPQFQVADVRHALALASSVFFDHPSEKLSVAGITGTNGKTTTTYLIDWIMHFAQGGTLRHTGIIGTVETRIGSQSHPSHNTTPESLDLQQLLACMVEATVTTVAMEVSSHAIDLDRVAGIHFAAVGFSNLTQDHLDYHHDMEAYFEAKASLFDSPLTRERVICIDDVYGQRLAKRCSDNGFAILTTGYSMEADIHPLAVEYGAYKTHLTVMTPEGTFTLDFPLIGRFNVENLLLAAGVSRAMGVKYPVIFAALEEAPQVPGRLERVHAKIDPPFTLFVDYAHTPDSVQKAIAAVEAITTGRTLVVFGCGGDRDAAKRPLMGAAACSADYAIVTSDNPRSEDPEAIIADILPGMAGSAADRFEVHSDRRVAIRRAIALAQPGDAILVAGKGHEDYQLVGDDVVSFDDREVAREELDMRVASEESGEVR